MRNFFIKIFALGVFTVLFSNFAMPLANAQNEPRGPAPLPITVELDKITLLPSDMLTISGHVNVDQLNQNYVVIDIVDMKNSTIYSAKASIDNNMNYTHTVSANSLFKSTGQYGVVVAYANVNAKAPLKFIAEPYYLSYEGKRYPIVYRIHSGSLDNITVNAKTKSLILQTTITSEELTIEIPREVLDARASYAGNNSTDFRVFVDGMQAQHKQINATAFSRTLTIAVPYDSNNPLGRHEIIIMGTQVIPEFDSIIAMLVFATAIIFMKILDKGQRTLHHTSRANR